MLEIQISVYVWEGRREEGDNPWVYLLQTHISIFMLLQSIESALSGRRLQLGESTLYPQSQRVRPPSLGCTSYSGASQEIKRQYKFKRGLYEGHPAAPSRPPPQANHRTHISSGPGIG